MLVNVRDVHTKKEWSINLAGIPRVTDTIKIVSQSLENSEDKWYRVVSVMWASYRFKHAVVAGDDGDFLPRIDVESLVLVKTKG